MSYLVKSDVDKLFGISQNSGILKPGGNIVSDTQLCLHFDPKTMKCISSKGCKYLYRTSKGFCDQKGIVEKSAKLEKKEYKNYIHKWNI